jgi:hypothetical protein
MTPDASLLPSIVDLRGPLAWTAFDIPGGTQPVELVRLRIEPATKATVAVVRFPRGWRRTVEGCYEVAEEVVILDGSLEMSGATYPRGTWAWFPPRYLRSDQATPDGALAFARFEGPARWTPGSGEIAGVESRPIADPGILRAETAVQSRIDAEAPAHTAAGETEILELSSWRWAWVAPGTPPPAFAGPCFVREHEAP